MKPKETSIQLSDSREIIIETGKLAKQADGAVLVKMGNAMILATVVSAEKSNGVSLDFLPLFVDYQEKFASAGKIPGGFLKREGRLGDHEILISRLVDRSIRPLFPKDYRCETQVNITMISADENVMPDTLATLAASAAICISHAPFAGPVSTIRVAKINGQLCINPTVENLKKSEIDIIVAATEQNILMVEGEMDEIQEADMIEAIKFAHNEIKIHCRAQDNFAKELQVRKNSIQDFEQKQDFEFPQNIYDVLYSDVDSLFKKGMHSKKTYKREISNLKKKYLEDYTQDDTVKQAQDTFEEILKKVARNNILENGIRLDGRKTDEIRNIWSEIDYLPSAHGSALFTRGETQSLTTVTLGNKLDEQILDRALLKGHNNFMLHYNFPPFSTGEVKPSRGPSRREIGHGNLAMRAFKKILPSIEENPYTLRIVSDILESNGSSSMATVCASSLALMDAGVKIKSPVSGIAMGLVIDKDNGGYAVLSDILGDEDAIGDMDFKIAGTKRGITACQMDIKVEGISYDIFERALNQAKIGRLHILEEMDKTISEPRSEYKSHVPRIKAIKIKKDSIGAVIGPGGKVIQEIQQKSGATIIVEEDGGMGIVKIFAPNGSAIAIAENLIVGIVAQPEVGSIYNGKIKSIKDFGAFVEFMPNREGLLHISEVKWERISDLSEVLEQGEEIQVKLIEIDTKTGRFRLSRKALLEKPE